MKHTGSFVAGVLQEEIVNIAISSNFNVKTICNKKLYSFKLKKTTEIDLIVVSPYCIYVLEIKSYKTKLEGLFNNRYWAGISGKNRYTLYNPIFQNFEHIRTLRNNLRRHGLEALEVKNFVVLPDSCNIQTDVNLVVNISQLLNIMNDDYNGKVRYDMDKVKSLIDSLEVF